MCIRDSEHTTPDNREVAFLDQEELFFYVLFDARMRAERDSLDIRNWSSKEMDQAINEGNVIIKTDTIDQLAGKLKINPTRLSETILKYNTAIDSNQNDEFGRKEKRLKILQPPYYAFGVGGSVLNTHGGISINSSLEVIDENSRVIPGLYAIGETIGNGHLMGEGVVSGMSVGPAITFGRMVAKTAFRYAQNKHVSKKNQKPY